MSSSELLQRNNRVRFNSKGTGAIAVDVVGTVKAIKTVKNGDQEYWVCWDNDTTAWYSSKFLLLAYIPEALR